ncbi:uncharacterized protein LOC111142076 [Enhydra lutris kenyoni]|uniref:Uncharacterized protein LOC111142076 n=1 Tax=Enhydra lutris kenyoni TaxID=391180 RepID=A0A2Y9IQD3_ENHLU|nr:uncharacterized protein LOC111142076 [Enhydra lutris kenyoni]
MFLLFCFKQNLLCDTTTLSTFATSVNKYRHNTFYKKNTLHRNKKKPVTVFRIKSGKGIDASDDIHDQVPKDILRDPSNEEKHAAEDTVEPTELNKSETRPNHKSSPFKSTNGTLADVKSNFENEADPKMEKINQDSCENNKQEHENKEENELGKNDEGEGQVAEAVGHSNHWDPEESAREDPDYATVAATLSQCAEEGAQANSDSDGPVRPRDEVSQV